MLKLAEDDMYQDKMDLAPTVRAIKGRIRKWGSRHKKEPYFFKEKIQST